MSGLDSDVLDRWACRADGLQRRSLRATRLSEFDNRSALFPECGEVDIDRFLYEVFEGEGVAQTQFLFGHAGVTAEDVYFGGAL